MKILKMHLTEVAVAFLFIVIVCVFTHRDEGESLESMSWNRNWTLAAGEESRSYEMLPESVNLSEGEEEIIIRKELPQDISSADSIGYYTSHQLSEVNLDGRKIFERKIPEGAGSKTPGNCWNFIDLSEKYSGMTMEVHIRNCYGSSQVKIPAFYYGAWSGIVLSQIRNNYLSLMISFIMFTMGLVLVGAWFAIGKKLYFHKGVPWLGLFAMHFAVWSAFETKIPLLIFGHDLLFSQIVFMSVNLMLLPFINFIRTICNRKLGEVLKIFAIICMAAFAFSFFAQLMGWFDFKETIWMAHAIGFCAIISVLGTGLWMLSKKEIVNVKRDGKFWLNVVCVGVISVGALMDVVNYYLRFYNDAAFFSRLGCLIYIFLLSKQLLDESVKLIQAGKNAEALLEEAEMDALTCLKNRRRFESDVHKIPKGEFPRYSAAMFDLNNLKMMNDQYGHGVGDCYIINGSEIIRDVFGDMGEIYRIGGDEFCLISDTMTEEIFEQKRKTMCDRLDSLQGAYIKDAMQIASGFAKYSRSVDMNLQDTIGRADERMYQCKRRQKSIMNKSETA